jgi:hypothetical protein
MAQRVRCFGRDDAWRSTCQHAAVQPLHRIQRRQDCPLLPGREIRNVLACQHETAIDRAEVTIMQAPGIVAPMGEAAERRWIALPRHRHTVVELVFVLGMDDSPPFDRLGYPLGRAERAKVEARGIGYSICAKKHALARDAIAVTGITDGADRPFC